MPPVTIVCCGHMLSCSTGGYCIQWSDGSCDSGCDPESDTDTPTPLSQGSRRVRRLTVTQMRRGALRLLLGGAAAEVPRDDELVDLRLEDVSVAAVLAMLDD